jgi:hypothetical protein
LALDQDRRSARWDGEKVQLRFTAGEWVVLTLEERIARCRLMAEEALTLASGDTTSIQQHYLDLAMTWLDLASAMQTEIAKRVS